MLAYKGINLWPLCWPQICTDWQMCYLSAVADPERSGLSQALAGRAEDWAVLGWQSDPGEVSVPLRPCFAYCIIFCIFSHFSHAGEQWGVTEGYASFSGHARIVCVFPNLETHLSKSWLSVQPGCLINSLFSGFQLIYLLWVSAADTGQGSSHWVCQCIKGQFKINVLFLTESNFWIFFLMEVNWCSSYS